MNLFRKTIRESDPVVRRSSLTITEALAGRRSRAMIRLERLQLCTLPVKLLL